MTQSISPDDSHTAPPKSELFRPDYHSAHMAFYRRFPVDRPLIGYYRHSIYPMKVFMQEFEEREIKPEDLTPERWLPIYETAWERSGLMWGELLHWESPLNGFPWMEAIIGCPIYVRRESHSAWAGQRNGFSLGDEIRFDKENAWYQALLENTRALVKFSAGRFPVAPGIMRGITDLVASLVGTNLFYVALYDQPAAVRFTTSQLADFWIEVIQGQYAQIPPFSDGYGNAGLWLPGFCPVYQDDASALISAKSYEDAIGPFARLILEAFPYPIMHLHSAGLQILPSILNSAVPVIIEVNIDPSGPPIEKLIPLFSQVQDKAPLEIFGSPHVIQVCLEKLDPTGIACLLLEPEPEETHD